MVVFVGKKILKRRRHDGCLSFDIEVRDGTQPLLRRKNVPRSEWEDVLEVLRRKLL